MLDTLTRLFSTYYICTALASSQSQITPIFSIKSIKGIGIVQPNVSANSSVHFRSIVNGENRLTSDIDIESIQGGNAFIVTLASVTFIDYLFAYFLFVLSSDSIGVHFLRNPLKSIAIDSFVVVGVSDI